MTILITGATGYIGREFIRKYQNEFDIIALVREKSNIADIEQFNCKIIKFNDFTDINLIFQKNIISGIVHFASNVIVEHNQENISNLIDSNIKFGTYLLDLSKMYNVKWFINTGTFWQNYKNEDYNPVNLYAATKEAFQNIAKFYTQTSQLLFTTIKLNDTFGQYDTRSKIFNLWDKCSQTGKRLDMSNGEQIIDLIYIEDVINAFKIMIENLQKENYKEYNNKSYVVTSNQRVSLRGLADIFEKVTNKKLYINWGGRSYRNREVMIPYENGEVVPNWKPKYSLEKAIKKTMERN